ncbi:MAG: transglycosylase SLT domain-containing protein, partial [Bacteroidales bacterium]|nr:transglycosylase SLT domain-containing protein [Bacteroidales bacterium]
MKIRKYILALSFVLLFSTSADAQLFNRAKRIELQDSIVRLNAIIDSLQFVFDDLLDRSYEMLENETSKESLYDPFSDEDFPDTADSLLSVYYLQQDLSSIYETGIVNLEDTLLPSDIPDSVYIDRLNKMNSYIKIPYNNTVRNYIVNYTQKNQELTRRILGLAKYYMPIFEEIFIEYDLPQELKAMAVIESALNQRAVSRAKAKGMWQFMYQTALKYNLQID